MRNASAFHLIHSSFLHFFTPSFVNYFFFINLERNRNIETKFCVEVLSPLACLVEYFFTILLLVKQMFEHPKASHTHVQFQTKWIINRNDRTPGFCFHSRSIKQQKLLSIELCHTQTLHTPPNPNGIIVWNCFFFRFGFGSSRYYLTKKEKNLIFWFVFVRFWIKSQIELNKFLKKIKHTDTIWSNHLR